MRWKGALGKSMYIYFEDWSEFVGFIKEGVPHGGKIIKVYTSTEHPSTIYGRENMAIFEVDDTPFKEDEIFSYAERGQYNGPQLEDFMVGKNLSEEAKKRIRALFRFDNQESTHFAQDAMSTKNTEGDWIIHHPMEDIDGLQPKRITQVPDGRELHLDVFFAASLQRLFEVLGHSKEGQIVNPEAIISQKEKKERMKNEFFGSRKERK
jgi:hypothetical protein